MVRLLGMFVGALCLCSIVQAQELQKGGPNQAMGGIPPDNHFKSNQWLSMCPIGTTPVSGTCSLVRSDSSNVALKSATNVRISNAWVCTWSEPVEAAAEVWCLKNPGAQ